MEVMRMNGSSVLQVGKIDSFEDERALLRFNFLKSLGLEKELLTPLQSDASQRRYFRLSQCLLMDAPPPEEKTELFQSIAEILTASGLSVPLIYASDHRQGFLLIEDFGALSYRKALEKGILERELYRETVQALIHLHQQIQQNTMKLSVYDESLFIEKACLFTEWVDLPFSGQDKATFKDLWKEAYHQQPCLPESLLMKDVMVDNLLWLPSRQGFKRSGFIDFQDALWGPVSYDLVSLLEDARRDISPEFAREMLDIYFEAFPGLSRDDFWTSYSLWGAQRTTRILGVFYRLAKRDGKPHYLSHVPRLWNILERDLEHPHLKDLKSWFKGVRS